MICYLISDLTVTGVKCLPPKWVNQCVDCKWVNQCVDCKWVNQCVEFVVRAKYTCMNGLYVSMYNSKLTACKVTQGNR